MTPEVTTSKGAAEMMGIAVATLNTWRCRGGGPPYLKIGKRVIYRIEDVRAYMDARVMKKCGEPMTSATRASKDEAS